MSITAKNEEQPKYPPRDKCISKLWWYEYCLLMKKEQTTSASDNLGESQKLQQYAGYKESGMEDCMSYDIIYVKFLEKAHV